MSPPAGSADDDPDADISHEKISHEENTYEGNNEGGRAADGGARAPYVPPPAKEFDWRGWLLVGVIVVAFVVVPLAILYLQRAQTFVESLGLGLRDAYLVLPLLPALLLGATAVWVAVRSRGG